jgi:multiple sugar transport system substrate-binding protein|tara:strand:- start:5267 stop:6502 length:1236 start_codon:yes stop_codon:yes gene_type:complete
MTIQRIINSAVTALGLVATATMAVAQNSPVTLQVWSVDGAKEPGIADTFSAEFDEQNPDINIEYRIVPFDELVNETLRAYAAGNAPDIVSFDNPDFPLFSSRGAMLDLTDMIAESEVINPKVYLEGPLNSVMWDGKIYGVPKYANTIALYYNVDKFAEAGIDGPPATWSELAKDAAKLADPANGFYGLTWSARGNEEGTFQFLPIIQMSGGGYDDVNTQGAAEVLGLMKTMIEQGHASQDVLSMGQWDSTGTFNSGNAAMAISGDWEITRMLKEADFEWSLALLPTIEEGGKRSSALGGFNWGIMSNTEHPKEAFRLLEYFVQQDHRLTPEFGRGGARTGLEIPETGSKLKDATLATFREQMKYAQPRGPHPEWQKISKAIYEAMQSALTGQVSPGDALSQAQATIDGVLN